MGNVGGREELQPINVASHIISCSIQAQRKFPLRLICCCVIYVRPPVRPAVSPVLAV